MRAVWLFSAALFAATAMAQGTASPESGTIIRTSTRVVLVPVDATRPDGTRVADLLSSDLRVYDNGKPQTIVSFERMEGIAPTAPAGTGERNSRALSPQRHYLILLLDALNTEWSDQYYARHAIEHLLDDCPAGERVALFALSDRLRLMHDFTTDVAELRRMLHDLASPPPRGESQLGGGNPYSAELSYSGLAKYSVWTRTQESAAGVEARYFQQRRILDTFAALAEIARLVKPLPGQKDLLWVSSLFPLAVNGPNGPADKDYYYDQAGETAQQLSSAGLRVYPVDARGLTVSPEAFINIATMQKFAEETGGKAFYNSNDLTMLMHQALEDARGGYLLTYRPGDFRQNGAFHSIRVATARPGVRLRFRPGYFAETAEKDRP